MHLIAFLLFCHSFLACQQAQDVSSIANLTLPSPEILPAKKAAPTATNLIFQSQDDGQTWQDISDGLPEKLDIWSSTAGEGTVFIGTKDGLYRSKPAPANPIWVKSFSLEQSVQQIFPDKTGTIICSQDDGFFKELAATGVWLPIFEALQGQKVRTFFKTSNGVLLVGSDHGIFKSQDGGKTWKHVFENGWVIEIAESNGALICTNEQGILRSTDGGENWEVVVSEGGVGINVERIEGGFAAITYNTKSETRRVRISNDNGKTWQPIDAGLAPSKNIRDIKQVGKFLYCSHDEGVFRSADRGKTWELVLASPKDRMYNLSVMNGVLFAVRGSIGC